MTQLSIEKQIRAAAAQNTRLLQTLSDTDYAVSACQQSSSYINTLRKQIAGEEKRVKNLGQIVHNEYVDYKNYRDSHMRRLAFRIRGKKEKFEEQATKEEKEWLDAVQQEIGAKKGLEQLRLNLIEAEKTHTELAKYATIHNAAQVEMDELYNQIFKGPTPDIPEEDAKEREVGGAENEFNIGQLLLSTEIQATAILQDAERRLKQAMFYIGEAIDDSTSDTWGVGGTFTQMVERSALSKAQYQASQVEMLVSQARRVQPKVGHLGEMQIAQPNFITDMLFDKILTDLNMRDKIRGSQSQVAAAQRNLFTELNAAAERQRKIQVELDQAKLKLDGKRRELQEIRSAVFDRIAGSSDSGSVDAPPSYEAAPPSYQK